MQGHSLLVLLDPDPVPIEDGAAEEDLPGQLGVAGVRDVVLPDVAVDPVGEVEVLVCLLYTSPSPRD